MGDKIHLYGRKSILNEPSEDPLVERLTNDLLTRRNIVGSERYVQRDSGREDKWNFDKGLHDHEEHLNFSTIAFIHEHLAEAVIKGRTSSDDNHVVIMRYPAIMK